MPAWLRSRWVIVPGIVAAVTIGWNIYVSSAATGVIEGRVVDPAGRPVAGATVTLFNRTFITNDPRQETRTDSQGRFRFEGNDSHAVQIEAESEGGARSERRVVRLWFRAQGRRLDTPLVVAGR